MRAFAFLSVLALAALLPACNDPASGEAQRSSRPAPPRPGQHPVATKGEVMDAELMTYVSPRQRAEEAAAHEIDRVTKVPRPHLRPW